MFPFQGNESKLRLSLMLSLAIGVAMVLGACSTAGSSGTGINANTATTSGETGGPGFKMSGRVVVPDTICPLLPARLLESFAPKLGTTPLEDINSQCVYGLAGSESDSTSLGLYTLTPDEGMTPRAEAEQWIESAGDTGQVVTDSRIVPVPALGDQAVGVYIRYEKDGYDISEVLWPREATIGSGTKFVEFFTLAFTHEGPASNRIDHLAEIAVQINQAMPTT